ncbi:MAG: prepilin-type N-terminal cleavage/methylation domain-containing protein [Desulfurivibrionaceae bacterium]
MEQNTRKNADSCGFTLMEIIITIVILGSVAGILVPFFNAVTHSPDPVIRERAISLGQAMMDEIMAKRWDENTPMGGGPLITSETLADDGSTCTTPPTPCTGNRLNCFVCRNPGYIPGTASTGFNDGELRIDYDDVDDYHGLNETGTFTDQNGNSFALTNYTRQVAVLYIASSASPIDQNTLAASGTTDTKLVVVTVTSPLGETFYFVAVACNL